MHDQPSLAEREGVTDSAILGLLMLETSHCPWAVDEIAREMRRDVTDSLNRLFGCGLIHRLDGFVWATRAAVIADAIAV
jgi:hypothetical protein